MFNYNQQYITKSDIRHVVKSLKSNYITKGPYLKKFENKIKFFFRSKYCTVTSNATSSFFIISKVLGWKKKDNIILSPMTFVASANSVVDSGATPIFVDIKDEDQNLDPYLVEQKIIEFKKKRKKINAVIVTDYAGTPADWKKFNSLKKKYKFILINDNCHGIGSRYFDSFSYAANYADIVIHSYHAVKTITSAEGGAILTNNKNIYLESNKIREHGFFKIKSNEPWESELSSPGFNARLSELNCALGISQLNRLKKIVNLRKKFAVVYSEIFSKFEFIKIKKIKSLKESSNHLFNIRIDYKKLKIKKRDLHMILNKKFGINLQVHYVPTYKFNLFKKFVNFKNINKIFLNTENYYKQTFSIPLHLGLNKKDLFYIAKSIINSIKILKHAKKENINFN